MIAIDTNIVVRLLTGDDPEQHRRARALLAENVCFVPDTVILETGWVLESIYERERQDVARGLRRFLGLANVRAEDFERLRRALTWYADGGLDFADALHLAAVEDRSAPPGRDRLKTFDEAFIERSEGRSPCVVERPEQ